MNAFGSTPIPAPISEMFPSNSGLTRLLSNIILYIIPHLLLILFLFSMLSHLRSSSQDRFCHPGRFSARWTEETRTRRDEQVPYDGEGFDRGSVWLHLSAWFSLVLGCLSVGFYEFFLLWLDLDDSICSGAVSSEGSS